MVRFFIITNIYLDANGKHKISMTNDNPQNQWDEETSKRYLDYGRYFVPAREQQMRIMVDLLKGLPQTNLILELCCGEGLLAEMLLDELHRFKLLGDGWLCCDA